MGILNFGEFSLCYSTKKVTRWCRYTGESGLLSVAYAGESGLTGVGYTGKFGLPGVITYTSEYRSLVWPTQRTPEKNFSHKKSPA